eukprot:3246703-Pleurochrysis_carterae.AAC.1
MQTHVQPQCARAHTRDHRQPQKDRRRSTSARRFAGDQIRGASSQARLAGLQAGALRASLLAGDCCAVARHRVNETHLTQRLLERLARRGSAQPQRLGTHAAEAASMHRRWRDGTPNSFRLPWTALGYLKQLQGVPDSFRVHRIAQECTGKLSDISTSVLSASTIPSDPHAMPHGMHAQEVNILCLFCALRCRLLGQGERTM